MTERRRWIGLAGILVLGLALRLLALGGRPIWYDEAFSILLSRQSFPQIVAGTAADTMPPLFYFLLHLWGGLGEGIGYLRLLNVFLGLLLIPLIFVLGREIYGPREGLLAALLAATSPFLIYHAQELRMYTLLAVALLAYAYACVRLLRDRPRAPGLRWWALLVLSASAALYTHNLAVFSLVSPNLFLIVRRRWRDLGHLLGAQAVSGLLASPWLVIVPEQIAKIQRAFWTPQPGALEILQAIIVFHYNLPVPESLVPLAVTGTVLAAAFVIYSAVRLPTLWRGQGLFFSFLSLPPALLLVVSYLMRPLFVPRAIILSALLYYLLLAAAALRPPLPGAGVILLAAILLPQAVFLPAQYRYESFPRSPFRRAGQYLQQQVGEGEVVLHDNKLSYFPMEVYQPRLAAVFLPDEPGSHNDTLAPGSQQAMNVYPAEGVREAVAGRNGVWFVVFERAIEEYEALGAEGHPVILELEGTFTLESRKGFGDLDLYHYRR